MGWIKVEDRPVPTDGRPVLLKDPDGRIGIGVISRRYADGLVPYSEQSAWVDKDAIYFGRYRASEAIEWCEVP